MSAYEDAIATLYRAPFAEFVAERKRLAAALKANGEPGSAAKLGKLARPPISAWTVNQLWWRERKSFDALLAAAAQVKVGDQGASRAHRDVLGQLRQLAAHILNEAGNAASDTTLRRVTTTLSAIAALGHFDPDPPGALSADRDPPGFEALSFGASPPAAAPSPTAESERRAESERLRAEREAEQRRSAERERIRQLQSQAQAVQAAREGEVARLRAELASAEQGLVEAQALLAELEQQLTALVSP
jgi:hypothetical protein